MDDEKKAMPLPEQPADPVAADPAEQTSDLDDGDEEEPEIVTMMDVLKEETELEENADAGKRVHQIRVFFPHTVIF